MKEEHLGLFDLVLFKIKDYKGYTVFNILRDADPGSHLYRFDSKEDFEKVFTLNGSYVESIDEDEVYSDDGFYLAIDGKLIR